MGYLAGCENLYEHWNRKETRLFIREVTKNDFSSNERYLAGIGYHFVIRRDCWEHPTLILNAVSYEFAKFNSFWKVVLKSLGLISDG